MREYLTDRKFLHATAVLVGTMVGVGIFSIPLAFTKSGFLVGFLLAIAVGFITALYNLMYAEIILRTKEKHQLVGYTDRYLGTGARRIIFFANLLGIWGALLAYIHYAGGFLNTLLSEVVYVQREYLSAIFFFILAGIIPFGIKIIAGIEFFLTALFIAVILITFGVGAPHIDIENLKSINVPYWFLPYGVLLFAFAGLTSLPIQRQLLTGKERMLKPSIHTAVIGVGVLYVLFALVVVGVSGFSTSDDAISGLIDFVGPEVVFLGSLFGIMALSTSFLMLGEALLQIFMLDYQFKLWKSWALVVLPPFILYMGGLRSAIDVISLVGAVAIGVEALVLLYVYRAARREGNRTPEFTIRVPDWAMVVLGMVFIIGIIFELFIRY